MCDPELVRRCTVYKRARRGIYLYVLRVVTRLGWPYCLWLDLPPFGCLYLKCPQPPRPPAPQPVEDKANLSSSSDTQSVPPVNENSHSCADEDKGLHKEVFGAEKEEKDKNGRENHPTSQTRAEQGSMNATPPTASQTPELNGTSTEKKTTKPTDTGCSASHHKREEGAC